MRVVHLPICMESHGDPVALMMCFLLKKRLIWVPTTHPAHAIRRCLLRKDILIVIISMEGRCKQISLAER